MEEIWRDIEGYEGLYQVSNLGRVKSLTRIIHHKNNTLQPRYEKIMNAKNNQRGYLKIRLSKNSKRSSYYVHRLVALTFIPNDNNKRCVNHKDCNKLNNILDNLEWATDSENIIHAYNNNLFKTQKRVICIETNEIFNNLIDAYLKTGTNKSKICGCCNKKIEKAGGYHWEYIND